MNLPSALWYAQIPEKPSQKRSQRRGWTCSSPILLTVAWLPLGQACASLKNGLMIMSTKSTLQTGCPGKTFRDSAFPSSLPSTASSQHCALLISHTAASVLHICICHFRSPRMAALSQLEAFSFFPRMFPEDHSALDKGFHFLLFLLVRKPLLLPFRACPGLGTPYLQPTAAGTASLPSLSLQENPGAPMPSRHRSM